MKKVLKVLIATLGIVSLSNVIGETPSVQGQTATRFICAQWEGYPTTIAQTPEGNIPVIQWTSDYFEESGYTREVRCREVSDRFNEYYGSGQLKYLTTGRMNRHQVVCVTQDNGEAGGGCQGLLLTLKPESDPNKTLLDLMAVRVQKGGALNETAGRVYIDMDKYLEEANQNQENQGSSLW